MKREIQKALLKRKVESSASTPSDPVKISVVHNEHNVNEATGQKMTSRSQDDEQDTKLCDRVMMKSEASVTENLPKKASGKPDGRSNKEDHEDPSLPQHVVCLIEPDIGISQFMDVLTE